MVPGEATDGPAADDVREVSLGESRVPPAAALLVYLALNIALGVWLPNGSAVRVRWLVPAVEAALLLLLVVRDPAGLARRTRWLHRLTVSLVCLLVASAL